MDSRWQQLGEMLVGYSTDIQPGERVMIAMHEAGTLPLVRAVYEAAVRAGAHVQVQFFSDALRHTLLRWGSAEQVGWVPEIEAYGMEWADVYLGLRGAANPFELADIPSERLAAHQQAQGIVSALRWEKTRWCLVRVPTEALAQQAETDLETVTDRFFAACLRDWEAEAGHWRDIARVLEAGRKLRLLGQETDLTFSVAGRKWLVADGHINMPDGEIYTAPEAQSASGHIAFELGIFGGRQVRDIRLAWRDGELVSASAGENETLLHQVLATDPGASRVGEFAFGTNDAIDRLYKDMLLDEKMGGTVHLALGRAYPACGGDNRSAIHWDIVKDTRREGAVELDGHVVFENGRFLI